MAGKETRVTVMVMVMDTETRLINSGRFQSFMKSDEEKLRGHHGIYMLVKRFLDIVFSVLFLVLFAIPMLGISIVILITEGGPILFKQERVGYDGEKFIIYKFRSMLPNAPEKSNREFADADNYITKLGSFLRKSSLDEMPQIFNVLKGEMSFIGPRPLAETDEMVLKLRNESGATLVRPGISGWAQVNGRNTISDENKAALDSYYAANISLLFDIKILLLTISNVIKQTGINAQ